MTRVSAVKDGDQSAECTVRILRGTYTGTVKCEHLFSFLFLFGTCPWLIPRGHMLAWYPFGIIDWFCDFISIWHILVWLVWCICMIQDKRYSSEHYILNTESSLWPRNLSLLHPYHFISVLAFLYYRAYLSCHFCESMTILKSGSLK